jgi:uncharacterized protein (UPF0332 family)
MQLSENVKSLCKYRIESAKEDLQTAKVDYDNGLYKGAINRAYYCIFHSIRAVIIQTFILQRKMRLKNR